MILYDMYAGRVKHEPNKAVQRVEGGVERENQGGEEGGKEKLKVIMMVLILVVMIIDHDYHDDGGHYGDCDPYGFLHRFRSRLQGHNDRLGSWPRLVLTSRCCSILKSFLLLTKN